MSSSTQKGNEGIHNPMHRVTDTFPSPVPSLPLCMRWAMTSSDASATVLLVSISRTTQTPLCTQADRNLTEAECLTFSSFYTSSTFLALTAVCNLWYTTLSARTSLGVGGSFF
ncbi:hypothetical protein L798_12131 [Zootermopsis nevadensis]|uniref:Uncharacterized protein n=1 Tax=Zootermopsis nevadensis TaxID=136037 RepID=A0A067R692_ZOONE|nr:hypothetical protein L798_12131 [Zootermopsis nevadensis]